MSTELLSAVSELTAAVETKVAGMARASRDAASEIQSIKSLLVAGTAVESAPDRAYREAFRVWLATKDTAAINRVLAEHKDVSVGTAAAGGFGVPRTLADAIYAFARVLNPWMDPAICGVETVSGTDFREPMNLADNAALSATETGSRSATGTGTFRECCPVWGEYYCYAKASQWARQDVSNLEAHLVREFGRQLAAKLGADIWAGSASGAVHGLTHTTPSSSSDSASPMRGATALQYVSSGGSPVTSLHFSDIENLLGQFGEEYLAAPDFAFIMRAATWRALVAAEDIAGTPLTMPRQPTLYGYPVKFCGAVDAIGSGKYPVAAGAWKAAYKLVAAGELAVITDPVTAPGFVLWNAHRRFGGIVRDGNAAKLLKCG